MADHDQLSPWWSATRHADIRPFWAARSAITKAIRAWFDEQGFAEVETGILQVSPGNETHLHAPRTELTSATGALATRYLRTSPEFACKKLLAAGEPRIFEFARVFRDRERGDLHLPEFTMLEWYRADAAYDAVMADSVVIIAHAAQATGIGRFSFRGRSADPFAEPELLTVAAAFERFAGIDLLATVAGGEGDRAGLAAAARTRVRIADDDTLSDIFSKGLVEHIEPPLGQRRRFMQAMDEKARRYGERYPLDEDFLDAVAKMPEASGVALGFDRLVMLAGGALRIDQVVWTPPAGEA